MCRLVSVSAISGNSVYNYKKVEKFVMRKSHLCGLLLAAASLVSCTYSYNTIDDDGVISGDIIFPEISDANMPDGIFLTPDEVKLLVPGITKADLYRASGRPHFDEGHGAREWDYILKFREPDLSVKTCLLKVTFDDDNITQQFYWSPENCHQVEKEPEIVVEAPIVEKFSLDADALFAFDKWKLEDMKLQGRNDITELSLKLHDYLAAGNVKIQVVGHTDYIGDDMYNMTLSQLRAQAVRQMLIQQGIPSINIGSEGMGELQPIIHCDKNVSRSSLISCLQPNRRVEVIVQGQR